MRESYKPIDRQLRTVFEGLAFHSDPEKWLFDLVFYNEDLTLADVERLHVVADRLELFVRCRKAWKGK